MTIDYIPPAGGFVTALLQGRKMRNRHIAVIGDRPTIWALIQRGRKIRVREEWAIDGYGSPLYHANYPNLKPHHSDWHTADTMPDWMTRMVLEVTGTHFEKLQDITDKEALLEGIEAIGTGNGPLYRNYLGGEPFRSPRNSYASFWDSVYGRGAWAQNLPVIVLQFIVHHLAPVSRGEAVCH